MEERKRELLRERMLLIFSDRGCMTEHLPLKAEGVYVFFLTSEVTGGEEQKVSCTVREGKWYLREKPLVEGAPLYAEEENGQKLLYILSEQVTKLQPCRRYLLKKGETVRVGCAYQNRIFYESFSLVEPEHLEIGYADEGYVIKTLGRKGVYLNGKRLDGTCRLVSGDRIDLYGLHMLVLKDLLVVCIFQGIYRMAEKGDLKKLMVQKAQEDFGQGRWIERYCKKELTIQEAVLHEGEFELLPPAPRERRSTGNPLLTIGPGLTMILPILLMTLVSSHFQQTDAENFLYSSVIMSMCSSFLAVFWGLANYCYSQHQSRKKEKNRNVQYCEYLAKTEEYLHYCQEENRAVLEQKYPPVGFFLEDEKFPAVMWNRYYGQEDFLFLRVATGRIPFQMHLRRTKEKTILPDDLEEKAKETEEKFSFLQDVPVGIDFRKYRLVGITGEDQKGVLWQLLFQIAACHSYTEVKVVCFYDKRSRLQRRTAESIRWMPHCWSADQKVRFLSGDEKETGEILPVLAGEWEKEDGKGKRQLPWYLVIILDDLWIKGEAIYQRLTDREENAPFSVIFFDKDMEALPAGCDCMLYKKKDVEEMICYEGERIRRERVRFEVCEEGILQGYLRHISGYRIKQGEKSRQIPEQVSFLELYHCKRVQQLDCISRWEENRPEERMKIPIGAGAGGERIFLDIHEKFHGPHGLIAGTTGAGKSELIQTCILSMAVSFSPQDVNFFVIDYKGGGTAYGLQELPHCSGVISNLSGKQIRRAMSAISSENTRRQKLLSEYGVNHIDRYMELYRTGQAKDAMPHLILVVDEFAELKKEEPGFMQEIISLSRIGRSLGMHLILATQKPAGTIDDKIWSNARFRLCLKVQDQQDSMDMLRKKDAAWLTLPGQCYLQIGNHEYYERFQTAYCGTDYGREDEEETEKVFWVLDTGKRIREEKVKHSQSGSTQLEEVVSYVNSIADAYDYQRARNLWMPELEQMVLLEELKKEEFACERDAYLIGKCDDPEDRRQYPATYIPKEQGHLAIFGGPATGKTTVLQTILWQMVQKSTDDIRILIGDPGGGMLQGFESFPHVLGVWKQKEETEMFFYQLEKMVRERKRILSGMNYLQYQRTGRGKLPEIFLVMDPYGSLAKFVNEQQEEFLLRLAAEGINKGIYLIITAAGVGELPGKLFGKIKKTIAFEMNDRFSYGDIFRQYHITVFPAENTKGRGLCRENEKIVEFQAALALAETDDYLRKEQILEEGRRMTENLLKEGKSLPERFLQIPHQVDSSALCRDFSWEKTPYEIPLGYDLRTGILQRIDTANKRCFLIAGEDQKGKKMLLQHLMRSLLRQQIKVILFDQAKEFTEFRESQEVTVFTCLEDLQNWYDESAGKQKEAKEKRSCLLIGDLIAFVKQLYEKHTGETRRMRSTESAGSAGDGNSEKVKLSSRWENWEAEAKGEEKLLFLAAVYRSEGDYEAQSSIFFREFVRWQYGIHLGGSPASQRLLNFDDLSYSLQMQKERVGVGYFKEGTGSKTKRLALPGYEAEEV